MGSQMRNASLPTPRASRVVSDLLLGVGRHSRLGPLRLPPADFDELGTGVVPALTGSRADLADDPLLAWIGVRSARTGIWLRSNWSANRGDLVGRHRSPASIRTAFTQLTDGGGHQ
jgi:hypothetical protein